MSNRASRHRGINAASATLTVRLPKGLKRLVADEAACRARGLADLVRERLYDAVCAPASAASHQAQDLQAFLDENDRSGRPPFLLLVHDPRKNRSGSCFRGQFDPTLSNATVLTIRTCRGEEFVVPRVDIVGWFGGAPAALSRLAACLRRNGWDCAHSRPLITDTMPSTD